MKLIIGLGNPGHEYEKTRHNAGFMVVDALARQHNLTFTNAKFGGVYAKGNGFLVAKPGSFMNLSGSFVQSLMRFYKIQPESILVIVDDTSHPLGEIALKPGGSHAGHNGLKDIINKIGTSDFARLKVGVGKPDIELSAYVLSKFKSAELAQLGTAIERARSAIEIYLSSTLEKAMVFANTKL